MLSHYDPCLILLQIISLQCLFYFSLGSSIFCVHLFVDKHISLQYFFSPMYVNLATIDGVAEGFCMFVASLTGYVGMHVHVMLCCRGWSSWRVFVPLSASLTRLYFMFCFVIFRAWLLSVIVEKSKKCVDFTFTLFFLHTLICTFYEVCNVCGSVCQWLYDCVCVGGGGGGFSTTRRVSVFISVFFGHDVRTHLSSARAFLSSCLAINKQIGHASCLTPLPSLLYIYVYMWRIVHMMYM